jgi:signal transduction histidine kinase
MIPARGRFLLMPFLLAPLVVVFATGLEAAKVARLAIERATIECELVADSVRRQLDLAARERPDAPLADIATDPRIQLVLGDAIQRAPSILQVAVADTNGVIVAHSIPSRRGKPIERHPALPLARDLGESIRALWTLRGDDDVYESFVPLTTSGTAFAAIQVAVTGSLLRDSVRGAFSSGVLITFLVLTVAVASGAVVTRFVFRELRTLEERVAAMREGRFEAPPAESAADEFGRLAHELDLLGRQFQSAQRTSVDRDRVLQRLGEMATGVAHELRDPLQSLSLSLEAVSAAGAGDPSLEEPLQNARRTVGRLDRGIRGFLTIARVRPAEFEGLDVNELVRAVHRDLEPDANLAGLELELRLIEGLPPVLGDPAILRQALQNLVRNSIHAQPSREGRVELRTRADGDKVLIAVADTGPGIPPEHRERVFDLLFTTRQEGTGVGLALVKQVVEMHGGDALIASDPGGETVVTMELPSMVLALESGPALEGSPS